MAHTEKLTAIADEIRGKTNMTDGLTLGQMGRDVAALPAFPVDVPDYVQTEAERVAAAVKALQNDNTLSFIALSDTHIGSGSYDVSVTHAMQAAHIIQRLVPIDFTAHLGDHVTGAASDSLSVHLGNLMESLCVEAVASPALRLVGNHDANSYNAESYLSAEDTDRYIGRYARDVVKPSSEPERGYFYADIERKKTRVICLNTGDQKDIAQADTSDGHYVSAAQLAWLVSALDMTGKDGWRVIVLSHHPVHWYGGMPNVLTILDAYVAGTSGSVTSGGASVSCNFSGKNAAKLVATFHGHTHNLIHGKAGTAEIIRMGTPNACYSRSNEYGSSSYDEDFRNKYGETTTYSKTAGSAKDTAFCVYTIDFEAEAVYATCYGAGYDRVMLYGEGLAIITQPADVRGDVGDTVTFTVGAIGAASYRWQYGSDGTKFYDLPTDDPWTSSTTDTLVVEKITTSSADWYFRCKLTGLDGTLLYTDVVRIIPRKVEYTVDIASVGYTANSRWSTSTGELKGGATGIAAINLIPFEREAGQTVTVKLAGLDWVHDSNCTLVMCADGAVKAGAYLNTEITNANYGLNVIHDGNGEVRLQIYDNAQSAYDGINGFKCSGYGEGSDAVITISVE